jgi:hypothetical protein
MTKLTIDEISLLVEICKSTTTRVDQALPVITIINKLAEMGKELQNPMPAQPQPPTVITNEKKKKS